MGEEFFFVSFLSLEREGVNVSIHLMFQCLTYLLCVCAWIDIDIDVDGVRRINIDRWINIYIIDEWINI